MSLILLNKCLKCKKRPAAVIVSTALGSKSKFCNECLKDYPRTYILLIGPDNDGKMKEKSFRIKITKI